VEIELNEIDDFSGNNSNQGNNMGWTWKRKRQKMESNKAFGEKICLK
jgi:hypothetical protein